MKMPPLPHHLLVGALVAVAAGLSVFVLAGGGGSLPPAPHVPAAVVAANRIESAIAALPPSLGRADPAHHARATLRSVRATPRLRRVAQRTVRRHPRRIVVRRPITRVAPATPTSRISAPLASAKPALGKHGKQRGRHATRAKGRRAAKDEPKDKQSHKKTEPARGRVGDHGNHGGGNGDHGAHGDKEHQGGK
jgi:hypothetical protein